MATVLLSQENVSAMIASLVIIVKLKIYVAKKTVIIKVHVMTKQVSVIVMNAILVTTVKCMTHAAM